MMLVESHHLLASGEPRDKYIPLVSTVSVSPTYSSQNFCIDKHFILSIDSKHTLKWLAEEELLCPYLIQYLPLHKLKNPPPLNYREKGQNTTAHKMWQIPITPSFPVQFGLSSPPSVKMTKLSCCLDAATWPSQGSGRGSPCTVPPVSSRCQCRWCPTLWSPSTKSSSLAWEGSMLLLNARIYLWRKGTGGQNLSQQSLHLMIRNTVLLWALWELPKGLQSRGGLSLLTSWKNSFHRKIT